jgi:hypothetical protein
LQKRVRFLLRFRWNRKLQMPALYGDAYSFEEE